MTKKTYTGINIQWPISRKILSGEKSIETRFYPIPSKYLNQEMLLIETPGYQGKFKSRITAIIKFTKCFKYKDPKSFYADYHRHFVDKNSPWAWDKPKYGWCVEVVRVINPPQVFEERKGIVYTRGIWV
ncbi:MAG: hypothetical protein OYH77_03010 [Pseudomonadota bacterium]|nr:hypothetical protein [Pseudomonadota bacterium]